MIISSAVFHEIKPFIIHTGITRQILFYFYTYWYKTAGSLSKRDIQVTLTQYKGFKERCDANWEEITFSLLSWLFYLSLSGRDTSICDHWHLHMLVTHFFTYILLFSSTHHFSCHFVSLSAKLYTSGKVYNRWERMTTNIHPLSLALSHFLNKDINTEGNSYQFHNKVWIKLYTLISTSFLW